MNFKRLLVGLFLSLPLLGHTADYSIIRQYVYPILVGALEESGAGSEKHSIISSGSAVMIQSGYALTVAHVVPVERRNVMFIIVNNQPLRAVPIKIDRDKDLALLSVSHKCPCATLTTKDVGIDDAVHSVGYPLYTVHGVQIISTGNVQGWSGDKLVTSTITAPGGSGGGVFTKEGDMYKLVGITVAIASSPLGPRILNIEQEQNWLSFSIPTNQIRTFLKKYTR